VNALALIYRARFAADNRCAKAWRGMARVYSEFRKKAPNFDELTCKTRLSCKVLDKTG
jgi:hypothetical protein